MISRRKTEADNYSMFRFCFALILLGVTKTQLIPAIKRCKNTEFECDLGNCIPKSNWCKQYWSPPRCSDGSDQRNCNNYYPGCANDQAFCVSDKRCIPIKYICDDYNDCNDKSDETGCLKTGYRIRDIKGVVESRTKARLWLTKQRGKNWGWQKDTSRAITALFLSDPKEYPPGNSTRELMIKQLQIQLSEILIRSRSNSIPLYEVALYVHAMLSTCLDPRKFQGHDLVQELQSRIILEYVNPFVALAICSSNGTLPEESILELMDVLQKPNQPQWIDSKALAFMALASCNNSIKPLYLPFLLNNSSDINYSNSSIDIPKISSLFEALQQQDGSFGNLYTTAIVIQALLALEYNVTKWNIGKSFTYLMSKQQSDGSFGNIFSTYLVLPVLYGRTLYDLRNISCDEELIDSRNVTVKEELDSLKGKRYKIEYLIFIGEKRDISFGIALNIPTDVTFYDVMRLAAELDGRFRFEYTEYSWGKYIYSIFRTANDAEARKYWQLYEMNKKLVLLDRAPDKIRIKENEKYVYWYKLSTHFTTDKSPPAEYDTEE